MADLKPQWEHIILTALVLVLAALGGHKFWVWSNSHTAETLLADVEAPKILLNQTKEFESPQIVTVTFKIGIS